MDETIGEIEIDEAKIQAVVGKKKVIKAARIEIAGMNSS